MSKRFTETEKWNDPWFRRLTTAQKCLWDYMCALCDPAGVIDLDLEDAAYRIGSQLNEDDLVPFEARIKKLDSGKWHILKFLEFQYGQVSAKSPGQNKVVAAIRKHKLAYPIEHDSNPSNTPSDRVSDTLKEEEEEEDRKRIGSGKGAGKGGADESLAIVAAYCRKDALADCVAAVNRDLAAGVASAAEMLAKVQACSAAIRKHAPDGPMNRLVPRAKAFFVESQWNDPQVFQHRWEADEKKKGGAFPTPVKKNPLDAEPSWDWHAALRAVVEINGLTVGDLDQVSWRSIPGDVREQILAWHNQNNSAA